MIGTLLIAYFYSLVVGFSATLLLIFAGAGWGILPHKYLKAVLFLQSLFTEDGVVFESFARNNPLGHLGLFGRSDSNARALAMSARAATPTNSDNTSDGCSEVSEVAKVTSHDPRSLPHNAWEWNFDMIRDGIESVIQDEISEIFAQSPEYRNFEPRSLSRLFFNFSRSGSKRDENGKRIPRFRPFIRSSLLLMFSRVVRCGFLFPIRLALITFSFFYVAFFCILACFIHITPSAKTKISVIYCRIFTAGTGLVARYHNKENRPTRPGVAVANHLSPNDIQIICADVEPWREYLYVVTGQKHEGIIWLIERLVEKLCPSIWLERKSADERKSFTKAVLDVARTSGPVLIFPEGYCTNNQKVLQFRRAVFDDSVIIHPIAIRQDARFGDSYWSENNFKDYLLRLLTSWAIVYDVYYLPPQQKFKNETSAQFASRVQFLIADTIGAECANFDGGLYYKDSERQKYRKLWIEDNARRIQKILRLAEGTTESSNNSADEVEDRCGKRLVDDSGAGFSNAQQQSLRVEATDVQPRVESSGTPSDASVVSINDCGLSVNDEEDGASCFGEMTNDGDVAACTSNGEDDEMSVFVAKAPTSDVSNNVGNNSGTLTRRHKRPPKQGAEQSSDSDAEDEPNEWVKAGKEEIKTPEVPDEQRGRHYRHHQRFFNSYNKPRRILLLQQQEIQMRQQVVPPQMDKNGNSQLLLRQMSTDSDGAQLMGRQNQHFRHLLLIKGKKLPKPLGKCITFDGEEDLKNWFSNFFDTRLSDFCRNSIDKFVEK